MYLITLNSDECINLDTVERICFGEISDVEGNKKPTALVIFVSTVSKKYQGEDALRLREVCSSCLGFSRDVPVNPERRAS